MNIKKILLPFFVLIYFSVSLFALDENEYYSSVAVSDDGEYMCIATVHSHNFANITKHRTNCPDNLKESIWISTTNDWRKNPKLVFKFETLGWSHPTVCYDDKNDSFLVFHRSDDPKENGFYEFYRSEKVSPDYRYKKFTPFESHSGSGVFVKNDSGIYLVQDVLTKFPMPLDEWLDPSTHFSQVYKVEVENHNVKAKIVDILGGNISLGEVKVMGIPLERATSFSTIKDIQPVFATKNGLIIRDYDTTTWWYYNCLNDSVKKFNSKEDAKTYSEMLEKQRTIDALLPEIIAMQDYESNGVNQSEEISQTISKAISEALPYNLPETIADTISQILEMSLPSSITSNPTEGAQSQEDNFIDNEQESLFDENSKNKISVILYIFLIILSVLLLAAIAIILVMVDQKKKKSLKNSDKLEISRLVYQTQEQERASVSRDIHDSVVQDMRGIRLETELLNVKEDSISRQKKIENMATDCVVKLRNICYNLTPAELTTNNNNVSSKFELVSIIQTLAQQFTERTKIPCSVKVADGFKYSTYSRDISLNVFRVVQEALNNIEKHSYATNTSIYMQSDNNNMKIFITDDGIGFDTNVTQIQDDGLIHFGVQMMKDRMNLIGGTIKFISGNNDGTEIQLEFGE